MSISGHKNIRITPAGNYEVVFSGQSYGTFKTIEEAISIRDIAAKDRDVLREELKFKRRGLNYENNDISNHSHSYRFNIN